MTDETFTTSTGSITISVNEVEPNSPLGEITENTYPIGTVVRLIAGSPLMTVAEIVSKTLRKCYWFIPSGDVPDFYEGKCYAETFHVNALMTVDRDAE